MKKYDECNQFERFLKINEIYKNLECYTGKCTEEEREFLIDFMRSGIMNKDDIETYELISSHHPEINLPEVDF